MGLEQRGVGLQPRTDFNRVVRDTCAAVIEMTDGSRLDGTVYLPPGSRLLDLLNLATDQFIAVTEASMTSREGSRRMRFIAVNKAHIARAWENRT